MIKPTIGRVVWFWPPAGESSLAVGVEQPLPALIAHVWSDSCVNLAGFDANGVPFARTSILLVQEGAARPTGGLFCEWMPYQKGQAAKTELLEQRADEKAAWQKQIDKSLGTNSVGL